MGRSIYQIGRKYKRNYAIKKEPLWVPLFVVGEKEEIYYVLVT